MRDNPEIVSDFIREEGIHSAVTFKLVTFYDYFAYVLIRGTTNQWDMLTDAQLWTPAFLMQGIRGLLPFGFIWTPAIDNLIKIITKVESESIKKVSFYKDTTKFVKYLLETKQYEGIILTGHSLGGGVAFITGAQTNVTAISLSAPNAMLSRTSFDPPITADALDKRTFNIIPDRDMVPMIDDRAQDYEKIRCTTELNCHSPTRSLCEILYACGTPYNVPFLCECVANFSYPEPTRRNGSDPSISFRDACGLDENNKWVQ